MEFEISENKITEEELQALYLYLSMNYENMTREEKMVWFEIMKRIDKEFETNA